MLAVRGVCCRAASASSNCLYKHLPSRIPSPAHLVNASQTSYPLNAVRHFSKKTQAVTAKAIGDMKPETTRKEVKLTIKLTDEEATLPVEELTFEQLYRRILHIWEEGRHTPKKSWMFELVKKAHSDEEWDQMLIICRIFQHKMIIFNSSQATQFITLACENGNQHKVLKLMGEESPRLFCDEQGYITLMKKFLDTNEFLPAWRVLDLITKRNVPLSPIMFNIFIEAYMREGKLDEALRTLVVVRKMKVPIEPSVVDGLSSHLYRTERYSDILTVETAFQEEQAQLLPTSLPFVIGAHLQSGDKDGAAKLLKETDKATLATAFKTLIENAQTEHKEELQNLQDKIRDFN